jgi:3-oxoacyl-[acyl-carrier protein] reductase
MPMRIELNPLGCAWIQLHMAPLVILYDALPMDLGLTNKVAIITGSSRGLGLASAKALAAEGCRVTLSGRTEATLHAAAREVASVAGGEDRVLAVRADLTQEEGMRRVIDDTVDRFGGLDVLVNSVALARGAGLLDTPDAEWQAAFDHTLLPAVRASRLAVPHMTRRGGGSIIIIASIFGREAGGRMTYNAVKAAEISLAKSLAQQLASSNIRVNSVSPGSFLFEGGSWWKRQQENPAAIAEYVTRELPFGRFGRADELGDVVAFLASSRASWISGTSIVVDGCQSRAF